MGEDQQHPVGAVPAPGDGGGAGGEAGDQPAGVALQGVYVPQEPV